MSDVKITVGCAMIRDFLCRFPIGLGGSIPFCWRYSLV
jgi:hypothetical protein